MSLVFNQGVYNPENEAGTLRRLQPGRGCPDGFKKVEIEIEFSQDTEGECHSTLDVDPGKFLLNSVSPTQLSHKRIWTNIKYSCLGVACRSLLGN